MNVAVRPAHVGGGIATFDDERWLRRLHKKAGDGIASARRISANVRPSGPPQAVFKIVRTGGTFTRSELKAQMNYVLGKADHIIDSSFRHDGGRELSTRQVSQLATEWSEGWRGRVEKGNTMHLIMSFPKGADIEKVIAVTRGVTEELLGQGVGRWDYAVGVHTDREHPHAHIIVDRRNAEGELFYFAKNGEFTYDCFKDAMVEWGREVGLEMVNTSRFSRGLEPDQREKPIGMEGRYLGSGVDHYQHNLDEAQSYYLRIETKNGERTIWGKGLAEAVEQARPQPDERVRIVHKGEQSVEVQDRQGNFISANRNIWEIATPDRAGLDGAGVSRFETDAGGKNPWGQRLFDAFAEVARSAGSSALNPEGSSGDYGSEQRFKQESVDYAGRRIAAFANDYRAIGQLADRFGYLALADALNRAAQSLANGETLETKGANAMAFESQIIENEQHDFAARLSAMRDTLLQIDQQIREAPAKARPEMDQRLNAILKDVQELQPLGDHSYSLNEPAGDSIYSPETANDLALALKDRSPENLTRALEGSGIEANELAARIEVTAQNSALEAQWVERDIRAVAREHGYDLSTEAGLTKAQEQTAVYYDRVEETLGLRREFGADVDQLDMRREQVLALEEAKALATKVTLTNDESKRLTEAVEKSLGAEAVSAMQRGEAVKVAGLGAAQSHDFAAAYLKADEQFGRDHSQVIARHNAAAAHHEHEGRREERGAEQRGHDWD